MVVSKYICPKCGKDVFNLYNPIWDGHLEEIIIICSNCHTNYLKHKFDNDSFFDNEKTIIADDNDD